MAFRKALERRTQCGEADIVIEEGKVFAWRGYKSISSTVLISCLLEAGIDMVHVSAVGQKETSPVEVPLLQLNSLLRLDLALTIRFVFPLARLLRSRRQQDASRLTRYANSRAHVDLALGWQPRPWLPSAAVSWRLLETQGHMRFFSRRLRRRRTGERMREIGVWACPGQPLWE